jgi:RimJ/RimL family protein N-acetyltransferase
MSHGSSLSAVFDRAPLSRLVLRTPRLELRLPSDDELRALARLAQAGVHDPQRMPFLVPWTDPSPTFVEDFLAYHRGVRKRWQPEDWRLELAVFLAGQPIGIQVIDAENFAQSRTTGSASWLGIGWQGHGYGTEMRTAILELAFSGLNAQMAVSGAFEDNPASARVSAKLGYVNDGVSRPRVRGRAVHEDRFRITRERFESIDHVTVTIEGLDDCRSLFGVTYG